MRVLDDKETTKEKEITWLLGDNNERITRKNKKFAQKNCSKTIFIRCKKYKN